MMAEMTMTTMITGKQKKKKRISIQVFFLRNSIFLENNVKLDI